MPRRLLKRADGTWSEYSGGGGGGVSREEFEQLSGEIADLEDKILTGGGSVVSAVEPAEDDIPKVFFGGALQQTKDEAVVPFRYISKTQDFSGYVEIKAQGNSSMGYPKKNQTVKMFKDADCTEKLKVDFKGWGSQNKHCYKANWIDITHARNVVSARLWGDIVKSRANYEELPELLRTSPNHGAVDGFPVKVYADGVYQGRYTLNIPKDKWTFNMDDELDNHCVLCGEGFTSGCFRAANMGDWTDEIHDTCPESIKTRWIEVIEFVMNSTDEEFKANLDSYIDVDSLIDYDLFGLAHCGIDAYGKNQLYVTYDGQKWYASMYDMDATWGLYWNGGFFNSADLARDQFEDRKNGREGNLLYIRLEQCFAEKMQTRWAELKAGALSIESIINRFERFTDIASAELVAEDYASTTGDGAFTGIPSKTTNNIQQIRAFALARQKWLDEYMFPVACTGITLSSDTLTFTAEGTQTLTATVEPENTTDTVAWESDNTNVATVENGVVTAISEGNATITATCGKYSATCVVVVNGVEVDPLYPLENGTFSKSAMGTTATLTTEDSGHIALGYDVSGWGATLPIDNINTITADNNAATRSEPVFTISAGSKVDMVVQNIVYSDEVDVENDTAKTIMFNILLRDSANKEYKCFVSNITPYTMGTEKIEGTTLTLTEDLAVYGVYLWHAKFAGTVDMDFRMYVDGVRWI